MTSTATFKLEVSDVANIYSDTVMMNTAIKPFIVNAIQNTSTVANKLLDTVLVPVSVDVDWVFWPQIVEGATVYLPTPVGQPSYIVSQVLDEGYSYALATLTVTIANTDTTNPFSNVNIICSSSTNAIDWDEQGQVHYLRIPPISNNSYPWNGYITATAILPGCAASSRIYVRWKVTTDCPTPGYTALYHTAHLDIMPRHTHTWQQTGQADNVVKANQSDGVTQSTASVGTVYCTINGSTFQVTDGGSYDIKSYLITGTNNVVFSSTSPCSVTPSSTFKMFGG
jgi:hypothetical protein